MVDWTFKDALIAIQSPPSILASILQSMDGLRLGDICFAKIQTTLQMCALCSLAILEKWVENGSFNPECMADGDYSHSTAILVILSPNAQGTALESVSIGLIVHWRKVPVGQIGNIPQVLSSMLVPWWKWKGNPLSLSVGHFAQSWVTMVDTWLLPWILHFALAYPLCFIVKEDPAQMTFRSQQNHPVSFTRDGLLVHQLLMQDCPECEYAMDTHHGCLLIPRGMQFPQDLFPQIVIPRNHATPYRDPKTGKEAPFMTCRSFC